MANSKMEKTDGKLTVMQVVAAYGRDGLCQAVIISKMLGSVWIRFLTMTTG